MKKRILSVLLAVVFIICLCATQIIASADSVSSGYSSVSSLESQKYPINGATIVTLGDSITAFAGWQDSIEVLGATVINSGTGGQSVVEGMQSFNSKVLDYNPDFATIMFGFNDGNKGKTTGNGTEAVKIALFKEYYRAFVKLCRDNDIIPIIITEHTCVQDIWYSESRYPGTEALYDEYGGVAAWFDLYAAAAKEVAEELDVHLIDWNAYSKTFDEYNIVSSDGVHLADEGKEALGNIVSDYLSVNFPGEASTVEKPVYPKPNTVLIEDFNDKATEDFNAFNSATISVTDEITTGNNTLKVVTNGSNGAIIPTGNKPENAIGIRFKFYSNATGYRMITLNSETSTAAANRISDYSTVRTYVRNGWTTSDFYFADYPAKDGFNYNDIKAFIAITGYNCTAYYDDVQWIVEGTNNTPATTVATTSATTTVTTTTTVSEITSSTSSSTTTVTSSTASSGETGVVNQTTGAVYDNLSTAISKASAGDTLKLLSDLSVDGTTAGLTVSKSLTIDLGTKTLTSTNKRLFNVSANVNATLKIKNGSIISNSSSADIMIAVRATNDLVLDSVKVSTSETGKTSASNYGFVTMLSPSSSNVTNITAKNCTISATGYVFSDNNISNSAWNLYVYNSNIETSANSIILKKDTAKTYDAIIYSGHIKNALLNTAHYPNLKIAEGSYMTTTENGTKDTETTAFSKEYWVYVEQTDGQITDAIKTDTKVSIRLSSDVSGMRFYTTYDSSKITGTVEEKGTLIGPKDKIGIYLTIDDLTDGNAVAVKYVSDKLWENNEFVGSLVTIQDKNLAREFVARGYVKVDGVYYYSETTACTSVADVADAFIADKNSDYNTVADYQYKEIVDKWAKAND